MEGRGSGVKLLLLGVDWEIEDCCAEPNLDARQDRVVCAMVCRHCHMQAIATGKDCRRFATEIWNRRVKIKRRA